MAGDLFTYAVDNGFERSKFRKWTNFKITKEMICGYEGDCLVKNNINNKLCFYCKYRKFLDIPKILNEMNGEKNDYKI